MMNVHRGKGGKNGDSGESTRVHWLLRARPFSEAIFQAVGNVPLNYAIRSSGSMTGPDLICQPRLDLSIILHKSKF